MEQLIAEISTYAEAIGRTPQYVLRQAIGANWRQWASWNEGNSSPTLHTVDKIRKHIALNPPPKTEEGITA